MAILEKTHLRSWLVPPKAGRGRRGSSILEVLLYVIIAATVLTAATAFTIVALKSHTKITARQNVVQNGRFAITSVTRQIRAAKKVTTPATGASSSTLVMTMSDSSTLTYAVSNGALTMQVGAGTPVALTPPSVTVTSANFQNLLDPAAPTNTWEIILCPPGLKVYICHNPSSSRVTICTNILGAIAHILFHGDFAGTCEPATSARASVRVTLTVQENTAGANEYQQIINLYDTATVHRQN